MASFRGSTEYQGSVHIQETTEEIEVYLCHRCNNYQTNKFSYFVRHLRDVHSSEHAFLVRCGIANCEKTYHKIDSYLRHVRRVHPCVHANEVLTSADNTTSNSGGTCAGEIAEDEKVSHPTKTVPLPQTEQSKEQVLGLMVLKWREKYQLPKTWLSNLLEDVSYIVSANHCDHILKVEQCLQASNINVRDIPGLGTLLHNFSDSGSLFDSLKTEARQLSYFRSNFNLVEPIELILGQDHQGSLETFQYVPIIDNLRSLLSHEDIFAEVMNSHETCQEGVLSNFCDGNFCRQNALFSSKTKSLQICLYNDDFEVCNPIGTFRKKQKLNGMYFVIGNINPKLRSKLHVIQLVWLCKTDHVKKYGFPTLCEELLKDLLKLEQEGLTINRNDCQYDFKGTVSMIVADNLASHSIGGFTESFTANRICRFCMCTYRNLKETSLKTNFLYRTKEIYNQHLEMVQKDESLIPVYGIKKECPFNRLSFFHSIDGLPSDPMHDLLEGACPLVWGKVLTHFVHTDKINFRTFNQKLALFNYKGSDKAKKPTPLTWQSGNVVLKQTASQMSCLMRVSLYILGEVIPERDKYWQLLLYLAEVCDLVFAPLHNNQSVSYLHGLVKDFVELYLELFDGGLTPKMHYLIHYAQQISNFGPLTTCSSIRFESKHSYFKTIARKTSNMKNLALTLAQRHQLLQCYYRQSSSFLEDTNITSTGGNIVDIGRLEENAKSAIQTVLGPQQEIYRASSATVSSITYNEMSVVVTGYEDYFLQFGLICGIFLKSGKVFLLVSHLKTCYYSEHFHAYIVRPFPAKSYTILQQQQLLDPLPLQFYVCSLGMCVSQRYRLLEEFI